MLKELTKIAGINLAVLLLYTLICYSASPHNNHDYSFLILMMMFIGAHAVVNAILAIIFFIKGDSAKGLAFLISIFVTLVIGFSACFGVAGTF